MVKLKDITIKLSFTGIVDLFMAFMIIIYGSLTPEKLIGSGEYWQVYRAHNKHGKPRLFKIQAPNKETYKDFRDRIEEEVEAMNKLRDMPEPVFLLPTKCYFLTTSKQRCKGEDAGLVAIYKTKLASHGTLDEFRKQKKPVSREIIRKLLLALATAICALTARGLVHSDIKLENLVLDEDPKTGLLNIYLNDFSLHRKIVDLQTDEEKAASTDYAPESEKEARPDSFDVYLAGLLLVHLVLGAPESKLVDDFLAHSVREYGLSMTDALARMFIANTNECISGAALRQHRVLNAEFMSTLDLNGGVDTKLDVDYVLTILNNEGWSKAAKIFAEEAKRRGYIKDEVPLPTMPEQKQEKNEEANAGAVPKSILKKQATAPKETETNEKGKENTTENIPRSSGKGEFSQVAESGDSGTTKTIEMRHTTLGKGGRADWTLTTPVPIRPIPADVLEQDVLPCQYRSCKWFVSQSKLLQNNPKALEPKPGKKVQIRCTYCTKKDRRNLVTDKPSEHPANLFKCASKYCHTLFREGEGEKSGSPFCTVSCHRSYSSGKQN